MDALKAEIAAKKRKAQEEREPSREKDGGDSASRDKYRRRGEDEDERGRKNDKQRSGVTTAERNNSTAERGSTLLKGENVGEGSSLASPRPSSDDSRYARRKSPTASAEEYAPNEQQHGIFNVSNAECVRRLRSKGEPIRLFGESDNERRLRLRALELIEGRGEKMGQNDFMRALRGAETSMLSQELDAKSGGARDSGQNREVNNAEASLKGAEVENAATGSSEQGETREGVGMNSVLDLGLIKRDIKKVYPIIYYTLKGLMRDWEKMLAERPIEVRQSNQGKLVAATQVQTAEYMKPLFKQLRHRSVKPDVLARLAEIVHHVQKREYRHANDSYLQLSIGNAPWPIGVTMVGIHERSGREKIYSSNVAHVLNDEVSRKYIQSLKRLMTFAQTRYPPKDVSMLMG